MKNHDLVAFYQSRDGAEKAREELLSAGFDRDDVKVYANNGGETGGGFWDSMKEAFGFVDEEDRALYAEAARRGASAVAVSLDDADGPSGQTAIKVLQRYSPIDIDQQAAQWKAQGWTGYQQHQQHAQMQMRQSATQQPGTARGQARSMQHGQETIPVVEEELRVGKRAIQGGGVRIYSRVTEKPVQEQVRLREERVNVERRPVNRPISDADQAFKERTIEATETREEAVVDKKARVVEEVVLNKQANERTETVRDTVRRTDVDLQKVPAGQSTARTTATGGDAFVDQFANEICTDTRYRGRDWNSVEPEARRTFEQRYPGNKWDQFKDAVRTRWDRARSKV